MTKADDVVSVDIEIDGEVGLTLSVGVVPNEIGIEIQKLAAASYEILKAEAIGDAAKIQQALEVDADAVNKMVELLCKYGIRGMTGPEFADGSPVPCKTEEEDKTGYTILSKETLDLFLGHKELLNLATQNVQLIQQIGIGKFKKAGYKTLKEAQEASKQVPLES
jgi:hypothetical protein